ncbi:uncharacterized protein TM35_000034510 [Trypanosoma theileri]|uniref:Uncharacterized protein n=1 Tax=Trypanosoma theileri TaxID=67003 RepID=A0A1X0P751_9TRYP|nr:uncharacterized protein TM35_000034510 [Trypanosoma theileri]ORC92698.1 hypothetical protein TM35_000034510 [Trypanosoma theileri]
MLEEATPRAQLHLHRILSGYGGSTNGDTTTRVGTSIRSSPPQQFATKSRVNFLTPQSNSVLLTHTDTREKTVTASSTPNNNGYRVSTGKSITMSPQRRGTSSSPRVKTSRMLVDLMDFPHEMDSRHHTFRRDGNTQNTSQRTRRVVSVPSTKYNLMQDASLREMEIRDLLTSMHTRLSSSSISQGNDIRRHMQQVESDEAFARQFMEELVSFYAEGVQSSIDREEISLRLLKDTTSTLSRVGRFLQTPPEEVLRDPEWHLLRFRDNAMQDQSLNMVDILLSLQRFPATMVANYERLMAVANGVTEVEEPTPMLSIPQPHPQQQQQQQQQQPPPQQQLQQQQLQSQEPNTFGRRPSSVFSRCGSAHPTGFRSFLPRSGMMSPPGAMVMSASLDSVEDMPSSSTIMAHTVMRRMEREADTAWAIEDLQEESAYWQEETLRAMSEAERYIQMACTLLGCPHSTATNGVGEIGSRRMSITAVGSNSQKFFVHRVFIQLLIEKEEGERGKIEAQESKEWWNCWIAACERDSPNISFKKNGFSVNLEKEVFIRKSEDGISCVRSVDDLVNNIHMDDSKEEGGVSSTRPSGDEVAFCGSTCEDEAH